MELARGNGKFFDLRYEFKVFQLKIEVVVSGEREPHLTLAEYNNIRTTIFNQFSEWAKGRPILFVNQFTGESLKEE